MRMHIKPPDQEDVQELYSQGSCHIFALACGREVPVTGYRIMFDPDHLAWEDPDNPEHGIHEVVHVYAIILQDGEEAALDVFGSRPLDDTWRECGERFSRGIYKIEDVDEQTLIDLCSKDLGTQRDKLMPLHIVRDQDIDEARRIVREMLGLCDHDPEPGQ